MPFQIQNVTVNEALEQSLINTNKSISELSYNPVWIYNTTATSPGNFTTDISGYKVVNVVDSNNINIKYWINSLNTFIIANAHVPGGLTTYIIGVDGDNGANYFIQALSSIIDNGNNTYTIAGGDLFTGGTFTNDTKFYMSYVTK